MTPLVPESASPNCPDSTLLTSNDIYIYVVLMTLKDVHVIIYFPLLYGGKVGLFYYVADSL